jgi:uncharacterized protein
MITMTPSAKPEFRQMSREEVYDLLARNHIGRMAYARGNRIDIEPMHYVYSDGWLYGRTSRGVKLKTTGESWWPVAFEVDEIDALFEWRSAVVHGGFYTLSENGPAWEREERQRAIELLRTLVPATFTPDDPVPTRDVVFRIAVQEVSGRKATTGGTSPDEGTGGAEAG